jgi:uncharacterized phage protein (TIGR02216 family)
LRAAAANGAGFPWDAIMAFGLGRLRLPPDDFWAMTPREMASAMAAVLPRAAAAPGRAALAELMDRFPDVTARRG